MSGLQESIDARELIALALREDLGAAPPTAAADLTAAWTVPAAAQAQAEIVARAPGVLAGIGLLDQIYGMLDPRVRVAAARADGADLAAGEVVARVQGPARSLLAGERTVLNFLQRLSGVATLTRRFVAAVAGTGARITDTRKTTPGWRQLEKYAVRAGGGVNHRMGLYDAVLIKENHAACAGGVAAAVRQARQAAAAAGRHVPLFAEAESLAEVRQLVEVRPDRIMLDDMPLEDVRQAVRLIRAGLPGTQIEATGGVRLENVRQLAETGVDLISVGSLTHSAPALDLSMLFRSEAPDPAAPAA